MTFKKGVPVELPADQIADLVGDDDAKVTRLLLTYSRSLRNRSMNCGVPDPTCMRTIMRFSPDFK
jgi:hypothetical protein